MTHTETRPTHLMGYRWKLSGKFRAFNRNGTERPPFRSAGICAAVHMAPPLACRCRGLARPIQSAPGKASRSIGQALRCMTCQKPNSNFAQMLAVTAIERPLACALKTRSKPGGFGQGRPPNFQKNRSSGHRATIRGRISDKHDVELRHVSSPL